MSGATNTLAPAQNANNQDHRVHDNDKPQIDDQTNTEATGRRRQKWTNKTKRLAGLTILCLATTFCQQAEADGFIGCLLNNDVCNSDEFCFDDYAFGRCISDSGADNNLEPQYRYPAYSFEAESLLEDEMSRLHDQGFEWTEDYTQCVIQTALAAIRYKIDYDSSLCESLVDDNDDADDNTTPPLDQELPPPPQEYIIYTDPLLMLDEADQSEADEVEPQQGLTDDALFLPPPSEEADDEEMRFMRKRLNSIPEPSSLLFDIQTRTDEEPLELAGIDAQPLLRSKFQEDNPFETDASRSPQQPINYYDDYYWPMEPTQEIDNDFDGETDNRSQDMTEFDDDDDESEEDILNDVMMSVFFHSSNRDLTGLSPDDVFEGGQEETLTDSSQDLDTVFNRYERMDVKKPGPFFEASPNNFFLDKLEYKYEDDSEQGSGTDDADADKNADEGQQEYETPMSAPVKDKRKPVAIENLVDGPSKNYVHVALNNKFNTWIDGEDFIDVLAQELGIPAQALTDRTIENQHVQFRVEPNPQSVDASQMAQMLDEDVVIKKRLTDTLGVDIAKAAAGTKGERSSVMPHGRNLNLLILVVVGASTTASFLVGGLIFALARRSRLNKKVSKLQLSDDVEEDRGKLQEEYKQLCRDWSKSSQPASLDQSSQMAQNGNSKSGKPAAPSIAKIQSRESKDSNSSNRSSTSSWTDEPANSNMDISTGHMVLAYMEDHLKNKQRLEQEWVGLCGYEAEPSATTVAFKTENKKKNRYPDKLPYDHNRVILNALVNATNSDYINASTVTDHDPRNPSYIVCQGALGQTVADFWQMVWEQGCVVIVMLSRLQDNGYQLCTRYWPEEGSEQYHIFEVHLVSEHVWCEDYLVRSVYLKNTRTGETRTVTQFHFRSWPAHGVPSSTKALLEFRRKVNKSYRGRSCPIVVHCSDGVGRSGTYVLIDMVLNRLSKGCKEIDIAATLEHIRDQRGGMVQNRQQFEFCLMAVAEEVHAILKALPQ